MIDTLFIQLEAEAADLRKVWINRENTTGYKALFCDRIRHLKTILGELEMVECGGALSAVPAEDPT